MDVRPARGGRAIRHFDDNYLELLRLLREAADIEHSLMVQYLYAAFSVSPQYRRLSGSPVGARGRPTTLLGVAVQEMTHLHAVNSLLVELGGAPNLTRQDLPYEPEIYPFELSLEPLTQLSAAKYTYVEASPKAFRGKSGKRLNRAIQEVLGAVVRPNQLGVLYKAIQQELGELTPSVLSTARKSDWSESLKAIRNSGEKDHFKFFKQVFRGSHAAFAGTAKPWSRSRLSGYPSLPLPSNPTAYVGHTNQIQSPVARRLAWLGDLHYWMVLILLDQYYRIGDPQDLALAKRHMRGPLFLLGFELAQRWGEGMPFDILNLEYAPGKDQGATRAILQHLTKEADRKAAAVKKYLPDGYDRGINRDTLQRAEQGRRLK